MNDSQSLSAAVLGQIALVQSMVAQLPSRGAALSFVCRGLQDIPGTGSVKFHLYDGEVVEEIDAGESPPPSRRFMIVLKGHHHGAIHFSLSDVEAFAPYAPFVENLTNMLAVIFEERRQRELNTLMMEELEQRVAKRTEELEIEIQVRHRAEKAVAKSETKFRKLFTEMTSGFAVHQMIYDDDGKPVDYRFLEMNPAFEKLTGLNAEHLIGKTVLEALPGIEQEWIDRYGRVATTGKPDSFENYSHELDRYYNVTAYSPQKGTFAVIFDDVTVRRQAEEGLRASEERFRTLTALAPVGVYQTDTGGNFLYVNETWCKLAGLSPSEATGRGWVLALHPDDKDRVVAEWERAVEKVVDFHSEYRFLAGDGTVSWLEGRATVIRGQEGEVQGYIGTTSDITKRRQMDGALRSIVEATSPSMGIGYFRELASMLASTLGCRYALIGELMDTESNRIRTLSVWVGDGHGDNFEYDLEGTPCENVLDNTLCTYPSDVQTLFPDDQILQDMNVQSYAGVPLVDSAGGALGLMAVLDDKPLREIKLVESVLSVFASRAATELERLRAEQIREDLVNDLESKNAELERFTYTVSHDLKSPLITISGFLGLLRQDIENSDAERVEQDMSRIANATDKMELLLNDLLKLSRAGRLVNPLAYIRLYDIALEAEELVSGQIADGKVEVVIHDNLPEAYADHPRMREVYQNLLDNAVKYIGETEDPRVICGARLDGDEVVCFVEDNGIGIPPEYRAKVFELFDKIDNETAGSGVGLSLVKRIVEHHGGRIWIESVSMGSGSRFCFTLKDARMPSAGNEPS